MMFAGTKAAFNTFAGQQDFGRWYSARRDRSRACEAWIEQHDQILGYCDCCEAVVPLGVASGATFDHHPSLREGLICPQGLSGRARLVFRVVKWIGVVADGRLLDLILYEDLTPLRKAISRLPGVRAHCSLYDAEETSSGTAIVVNGSRTTHQDITASSYPDAVADIVMHCDVLEHIANYRAALAENLRILKPGGLLLFTAPFFVQQPQTQTLASQNSAGEITHLIPYPEYHADPVRGQILAYYRFGWSLLDDLRGAGFSGARVLVEFDVFSGLTSNNNPYMDIGNMPPLAVVAMK